MIDHRIIERRDDVSQKDLRAFYDFWATRPVFTKAPKSLDLLVVPELAQFAVLLDGTEARSPLDFRITYTGSTVVELIQSDPTGSTLENLREYGFFHSAALMSIENKKPVEIGPLTPVPRHMKHLIGSQLVLPTIDDTGKVIGLMAYIYLREKP